LTSRIEKLPKCAVILHLLRGRRPNACQKLPLPVVDAAVVDLCRVSHKRLDHFVRGGKCNSSGWPHANCCMVAASVDEDPLVSGSGRHPAEKNWLAIGEHVDQPRILAVNPSLTVKDISKEVCLKVQTR
jgi:hypothetical protein